MVEEFLIPFAVGRRSFNDEFFARGDEECEMFKRKGLCDNIEVTSNDSTSIYPCSATQCNLSFTSMTELELHFTSRHRYECSECRKHLPTSYFLDLHIMENHDSFFAASAEKKPMFQCLVQECKSLFENPDARMKHCLEEHEYPSEFKYYKFTHHKKTSSKEKPISKRNDEKNQMEIDECTQATKKKRNRKKNKSKKGKNNEIDDEKGVDSMDTGEMIGSDCKQLGKNNLNASESEVKVSSTKKPENSSTKCNSLGSGFVKYKQRLNWFGYRTTNKRSEAASVLEDSNMTEDLKSSLPDV